MAKINYIIMLLLLVSIVSAEDILREFTISTPNNEIYLVNYPYWCEVGEACTVYATNPTAATDNIATIDLEGSVGDMNYDVDNDVFYAALISASEENVNFTVTIKEATNTTTLANGTDILRFRIPFTITTKFYQNNNASDTSVKPYTNQFQYAMMHYKPLGVNTYSYELKAGNTNGFLNAVGSLFPYYKKIGTTAPIQTQNIFLYAPMSGGEAEIKVYENGTYDLYTINTAITSASYSFYEFGRPIANDATDRRTAVAGNFKINNETDTTYSVFISAWEVYKWHSTMNLAKIIFVLLLWGALVLLLSFLLSFWIPNPDMASQAFKILLIVFFVATSPLLILAFKVLM